MDPQHVHPVHPVMLHVRYNFMCRGGARTTLHTFAGFEHTLQLVVKNTYIYIYIRPLTFIPHLGTTSPRLSSEKCHNMEIPPATTGRRPHQLGGKENEQSKQREPSAKPNICAKRSKCTFGPNAPRENENIQTMQTAASKQWYSVFWALRPYIGASKLASGITHSRRF